MIIFIKEVKSLILSKMFFIYVILLLLFFNVFYISLIDKNDYYLPPKSDNEEPTVIEMDEHHSKTIYDVYGNFSKVIVSDLSETIKKGYRSLLSSYINNVYNLTSGSVSLNKNKQEKIEKILHKMAGEYFTTDVDMMRLSETGEPEVLSEELDDYEFDLNLDEYYSLMIKAGNIVGAQSIYLYPETFFTAKENATYEKALYAYNSQVVDSLFNHEKLTNGLARLFGTGMGFIAILFPCFIAIYSIYKDKKLNEIIYSKSVKSYKYIFTKYISVIFIAFIPILILALFAPFHAKWFISSITESPLNNIDYLAYIKVSVIWLLPTISFVTALSMLVSYLTEYIYALAVPVLLVFTVFNHSRIGAYSLDKVMIKFPSEFLSGLYDIYTHEIYMNRLFYCMISLLILIVIMVVYNIKRKAALFGFKKKFIAGQQH